MRIGEPARLMQNNRGGVSPTRIVETGAGMRSDNKVETPPTAEELKKSRAANLKAMEAARRARREKEERAKQRAEEAARHEAEGGTVVGLPGQWRGGWRLMPVPVSEQERAETGWFTRPAQ